MQDLLGPACWRLTGHWRTIPGHQEGDLAAEAFLVKTKCLLALTGEVRVSIQRRHSSSSLAIFAVLVKCRTRSIDDCLQSESKRNMSCSSNPGVILGSFDILSISALPPRRR